MHKMRRTSVLTLEVESISCASHSLSLSPVTLPGFSAGWKLGADLIACPEDVPVEGKLSPTRLTVLAGLT